VGNLYVVDKDNHRVRKVTREGEVSTLAGGKKGFADGKGSAARFNYPSGIVIDAMGNLYVEDRFNHRVRKVTREGEVSTLAGGGDRSGFADGRGQNARFSDSFNLTIDAAGNLYAADTYNHRIRKVTPAGAVSTLADGSAGFADGEGQNARFSVPTAIAMDRAGNLYVADAGNDRIRKVSPEGKVSTLAGGKRGFADGEGENARFDNPTDIAMDAAGNLYVVDNENHRIRKVSPEGKVSTLAGSGTTGDNKGGFADGAGASARFFHPQGIAIDMAGNLYVGDASNHRIRKITPEGKVSTLAGGEKGFADGKGNSARFDSPRGIALDATGNLYVVDHGNHRIRKVTPAGAVSTLAGDGKFGFADGLGVAARFWYPSGIAIDAAGNLYVPDNRRIRKVTPKGEVSTLAGDGEIGFADGDGRNARFFKPSGIAIDATGNLYVADAGYNNIRKITLQRP